MIQFYLSTSNWTWRRVRAPLLPFPGSSRCHRPRACAGSCSPAGHLRDWCTTAFDTGSDRHTGTRRHKVIAAASHMLQGNNDGRKKLQVSLLSLLVTENVNNFWSAFFWPTWTFWGQIGETMESNLNDRILCDLKTCRHYCPLHLNIKW